MTETRLKKLEEYDFPEDLKHMSNRELDLLCVEIREFLIDHVSKTGGHLASNLGVVELSVALHRVFSSPKDKLIWDVGHQAYVHKILTGRASQFDTLRQTGGLSGFPKSSESPHDAYDTGHSSTSLSAAAGLAAARDLAGENYHVVATIGDGALTGGMAYEALNNIGSSRSRVIVVVNDNGMSISRNTGSMHQHLNKLRSSKEYTATKSRVKQVLNGVPLVGPEVADLLGSAKQALKYALLSGGIMFEELGFTYLGPVNGHDLRSLIKTLAQAKHIDHPVLVHVLTKKGKGYPNAEEAPNKFHGIGPFDPETGSQISHSDRPTFSSVLGETLTSLGAEYPELCAITAAMGTGVGLGDFAKTYPSRYFDVGIAEAHAVTFAAGLAKGGMRPVAAIYSSFLQRAYDQIIEDVCLQNLPVLLAVDRAGCVGADGATHQGLFDLAYLQDLPNMRILTPVSTEDLRVMVGYALTLDGPCAIRYPRGGDPASDLPPAPAQENAAENLRLASGSDGDLWAVGTELAAASAVRDLLLARGLDLGLVAVRSVKPLDLSLYEEPPLLCTLEDGVVYGGFGEHLRAQLPAGQRVLTFGWPDRFIEHGSIPDLRKKYGLDPASIAERIGEALEDTEKRKA